MRQFYAIGVFLSEKRIDSVSIQQHCQLDVLPLLYIFILLIANELCYLDNQFDNLIRVHISFNLEDSHKNIKVENTVAVFVVVILSFEMQQLLHLVDIKIHNFQCELVELKDIRQFVFGQGGRTLDHVFHLTAVPKELVGARFLNAMRRTFVFGRFLRVQIEIY